MGLPQWAFAASLAACLYIYVGYPVLAFALARLRPRPVRRGGIHPTVSIVIPAHNEESVIERKILDTLALEYPRDRLEILVVSDGSTDRTEEIARAYERLGVRLVALPRLGKASALNRGAAEASGEVLVLTDANTTLEPDALARLVENFADPQVGGAAASKRYRGAAAGDGTGRGEGLYWRFDEWVKRCETRFGSVFAADGALYALRRSLYVPIEDPAQADDIAISARVVLQGFRLVFEPAAVAVEDAPADAVGEFRRKIRVTNHSLRALLNLRAALWTSGLYSVQLLSHKFFRHLSPLFLAALLVSSAALARAHAVVAAFAAAQLLFYIMAAVGFVLRTRPAGRQRLLAFASYFCVTNLAALFGIIAILRGRRLRAWTPRAAVLALLFAAPAAAQSPEPLRPPPGPFSATLGLGSLYESNPDHVLEAAGSYGLIAGVEARLQTPSWPPLLAVDYVATLRSYAQTDRWDRLTQWGRVSLARRFGSDWTVSLATDVLLDGTSEERERVDELSVVPRLEYRIHGSHRIRFSAARRFQRVRSSGSTEAGSWYGAADLDGRFGGSHHWALGYRHEVREAVDPRRDFVRSLYSFQYRGTLGRRNKVGLVVRHRTERYPDRLLTTGAGEVPRLDRTWQPVVYWGYDFAPLPELRLDYRFESRRSNDPRADFDAHEVTLTVRQPLGFGGGGREPAPARGPRPAPDPPRRVRPPRAPAAALDAAPAFVSTVAGGAQACGLTADSLAYCWPGDAALDGAAARPVSESIRFASISVGVAHACGLTGMGEAYCWGSPTAPGPYGPTPTAVPGGLRFQSIAAGARHTCALTADGLAHCWGDNRSGALGVSIIAASDRPVPVAGRQFFTSLAAGWRHTCGLTAEGAAYCWGSNEHGQLGRPLEEIAEAPRPVTGKLRFTALSAGMTHTCGITPHGHAYCWGANEHGQLGSGGTTSQRAPNLVAGGHRFASVSAGPGHTCAITVEGTVYCWGSNDRGQLGIGDPDQEPHPTPVPVPGAAGYRTVSAFERSCALTQAGELRCWGAGPVRRAGS